MQRKYNNKLIGEKVVVDIFERWKTKKKSKKDKKLDLMTTYVMFFMIIYLSVLFIKYLYNMFFFTWWCSYN
jgi:hypothetical protein